MIIEYEEKYASSVKRLLLELGEYIASIDKEGYNILTKEYPEKYFEDTLKKVKNNDGSIYLYKDNDEIIGLVVTIINNEETNEYDFCAPKRGRIEELIVTKNSRKAGIGSKLLHYAEDNLHKKGCKDILIGVFAYNAPAVKFYSKNGYHLRMLDMTKGE